jgi:hypothetical protein
MGDFASVDSMRCKKIKASTPRRSNRLAEIELRIARKAVGASASGASISRHSRRIDDAPNRLVA